MDMTDHALPTWLLAVGWLAFIGALATALRACALRSLPEGLRGHLYPASLVALLVLWQLRAVTTMGPALHVLGATLLVLMFGWRAAIVGLTLVLAGHTVNGAGDWMSFGVNGCTMVLVPVLVTQIVLSIVQRRLPNQPFGYILVSGFGGAGAAMTASLTACNVILLMIAEVDSDHTIMEFTAGGILLIFPEAFLTGTTVAWLAMFYPQAVRTWTPPWEKNRSHEHR